MRPSTTDSDELRRVAAEQAALRRVATVVARGAPRDEILRTLVTEIGRVSPASDAALLRFDGDGVGTIVGRWNDREGYSTIGTRHAIGTGTLGEVIARTGRPARVASYTAATGSLSATIRGWGWRSAVGVPVIVDAAVWGVASIGSTTDEELPPGTEDRLAAFTELLTIALANAQGREQLERLAEEQGALRRVATLVSRQAAPAEVFAAIGAEAGGLLDADGVAVLRVEADDQVTVVAGWGEPDLAGYVGRTYPTDGDNPVPVALSTRRPARRVYGPGDRGVLAEISLRIGVVTSVVSPIVVEGRPWGVVVLVSTGAPLPPGTEARLEAFTELAATAVGNVKARSELTESRARLVRAGDEARRRLVRDLHDGAQQRLVHTVLTLHLARATVDDASSSTAVLLGDALDHAERATADLRELAHGVLPSALTHGGLPAGVDSLTSRLDLPVEVDVEDRRFPAEVEATAYFIVAEALTNVVKHARARRAVVTVASRDGTLHVSVRDDGAGGADATGHGLLGIRDRATALGGRLDVVSPAGGGTTVTASVSLGG